MLLQGRKRRICKATGIKLVGHIRPDILLLIDKLLAIQ